MDSVSRELIKVCISGFLSQESVFLPTSQESAIPRYSICVTHRNNRATVEESLKSILGQIDSRFEVVVVDSESTDGSLEILRRYQSAGKIRLIVAKSSRGRGRQLAFEHSKGEFVLSNIDFDEIYPPTLINGLASLDSYASDKIVMVNDRSVRIGSHGFALASREVILALGGWRDLNYYEDYELWRRAAARGKYAWVELPIAIWKDPHPERKTSAGVLKHRYAGYLGRLQVGLPVFGKGEHTTMVQLLTYWIAKIAAAFKPSYKDSSMRSFALLSKESQLTLESD